MTQIWTFAIFGFCLWSLRPVRSTRCLSCQGLIGSTCESVTSEVECPHTHDSCFTVTRTMDYPGIGRYVEVLKNCSILQDCWFIGNASCDNAAHRFVNSCSIDCCIGDLCNNKTVQITQNSTTRVITHTSTVFEKGTNLKREVTHIGATPKARQAPRFTSGVFLTKRKATHAPTETSGIPMMTSGSSTQSQSNLNDKAFASWTSQKCQVSISSGNITTTDSSREVRAVPNNSKGLWSQLLTQVLMVPLGIIYGRF
ncbi:uncharacterized protein LOC111343379 [Stylophora pistillata]|uniref:uncharacterized protein LOC111343379 n=1 Tax=Stylophora pistillata TaxID=50429 RepID=UPI000C03EC93|nr:uncharacterized protein LOC111343379 [Stylophora pistillata]